MSDTVSAHTNGSAAAAERARSGVEQAEAGDVAGAGMVEHLREHNPADVEAVEQEASDGPAGRGLSR